RGRLPFAAAPPAREHLHPRRRHARQHAGHGRAGGDLVRRAPRRHPRRPPHRHADARPVWARASLQADRPRARRRAALLLQDAAPHEGAGQTALAKLEEVPEEHDHRRDRALAAVVAAAVRRAAPGRAVLADRAVALDLADGAAVLAQRAVGLDLADRAAGPAQGAIALDLTDRAAALADRAVALDLPDRAAADPHGSIVLDDRPARAALADLDLRARGAGEEEQGQQHEGSFHGPILHGRTFRLTYS